MRLGNISTYLKNRWVTGLVGTQITTVFKDQSYRQAMKEAIQMLAYVCPTAATSSLKKADVGSKQRVQAEIMSTSHEATKSERRQHITVTPNLLVVHFCMVLHQTIQCHMTTNLTSGNCRLGTNLRCMCMSCLESL